MSLLVRCAWHMGGGGVWGCFQSWNLCIFCLKLFLTNFWFLFFGLWNSWIDSVLCYHTISVWCPDFWGFLQLLSSQLFFFPVIIFLLYRTSCFSECYCFFFKMLALNSWLEALWLSVGFGCEGHFRVVLIWLTFLFLVFFFFE